METDVRSHPAAWVRQLTESVFGPAPFAIGDVVEHPDGRRVKIVDGRYWAPLGFSNYWTWRELRTDGTLGAPESGYGWQSEEN